MKMKRTRAALTSLSILAALALTGVASVAAADDAQACCRLRIAETPVKPAGWKWV